MPDDNQTQNTNTEPAESATPETPASTPIEQTIPATNLTPSNMPSEPQNSPSDEVDAPVVKDDNGAWIPAYAGMTKVEETTQDETEAQTEPIPESPQVVEAENPVISPTPVKSSNFSSGEQTPQTSTFEPLASSNHMRELLEKEHLAIDNKRQKRLDSIMTLFAKQTNNGSTDSPRVTNDEVEKFLRVSNATATRYLSILKKENKILQNGKTGKGVYYTKIN